MQKQVNTEAEEILRALANLSLLSAYDARRIKFLAELAGDLTSDELKTLILYLSFLQDGNTCLELNEKLPARWKKKIAAQKALKGDDLSSQDEAACEAIEKFFEPYFENIAGLDLKHFTPPFPIHYIESERAVFTQKFHSARNEIRLGIKVHFPGHTSTPPAASAIAAIKEQYHIGGFCLKDAQAEAVARAQTGSLIITGGPGTGKTTVVFYLLLELLKTGDFARHTIYLTAPSGKAAERLKESIVECARPWEKNAEFAGRIKMIQAAESSTIHRLLKYDPQTNDFSYNAQNPLPADTILVIDEASMIGVSLFAKLLSSLAPGARVYILGDKNQLPSVDAGAAFEELLALGSLPVVELVESSRFNHRSRVGKVATALQQGAGVLPGDLLPPWQEFAALAHIEPNGGGEENLRLVAYPAGLTRAQKNEALAKCLRPWIDAFYAPETELKALKLTEAEVEQIQSGKISPERLQLLRETLAHLKKARILCAARAGVYGVENLNRIVNDALRTGDAGHYEGEYLIITRNQSALDLFNGDSGMVVNVADEYGGTSAYFLLEKDDTPVFYRLELIAADAYEPAFAMSVHKAQGSGYDHLLFFLPEYALSPLATRQILYTGMTRIQRATLTILGTPEILAACASNSITRDTGILF